MLLLEGMDKVKVQLGALSGRLLLLLVLDVSLERRSLFAEGWQ